MKIIRLVSVMLKNSFVVSKEYVLFILTGWVLTIGLNLNFSIVSSIHTKLSHTLYVDYVKIFKGSIYFLTVILLLFHFVMIFNAVSRRNEIIMFIVHGFGFRSIHFIYFTIYLGYYLVGIILGGISLFIIIHYMNKLFINLWSIPDFIVIDITELTFWFVILLIILSSILSVWISIRVNFKKSGFIKKLRYNVVH